MKISVLESFFSEFCPIQTLPKKNNNKDAVTSFLHELFEIKIKREKILPNSFL